VFGIVIEVAVKVVIGVCDLANCHYWNLSLKLASQNPLLVVDE
ncbi:1704_t:CDS:2, partial [Gigaspora rosea]